MADEQDELLLTDEKIDQEHNIWCMRRGKENLKISWRQWIAKAQVAKLKAMGYKSPEECAECKNLRKFLKDNNASKVIEAMGYVKWDREKVAGWFWKHQHKNSLMSWDEAKTERVFLASKCYESADQLKEILGEK